MTIQGANAEQVRQAMQYENRWGVDPAITTPAYLKRFVDASDGSEIDIVTYASLPAAGGAP